MKFPLEKYRFYYAGNKVIAVSTYGGKLVKGKAICHPTDDYRQSIGERLAAARCNEKIAQKRYARAQQKYVEACEERDKAIAKVDAMKEYMNDSFVAMNEAAQECDEIVKELKA
jgi:hypothetical protein